MERVTTRRAKKAKKKEWASHDVIWYALSSNVIIAYSTVAAKGLIEALAQENPKMTIAELYNAINYDLESKKVLQTYINNGFGNHVASIYFDKEGKRI